MHDRIISLRENVWAYRIILTLHFIKVHLPSQEIKWSCIRGIDFDFEYIVLELFRQCDIFCFILSFKKGYFLFIVLIVWMLT
jgi:hypothetical protein